MNEIVLSFLKVLPWIVALCLAFMFRKPLSTLIERVADVCKRAADTKKISKTRDGLIAEFADGQTVAIVGQMTQQIELISEREQAVTTVEQKEEYSWFTSYHQKDYESTIRQLDEEIGKRNKDTFLELIRAMCYYQKDGFVEGVRQFETILNKYPTEEDPYLWLSYRYAENQLFDKAMDTLDRGLALIENNVRLLQRKGELYVEMGETVKAVSVAEDIVRAGIDKTKGYLLLVTAYEKEGGKEQKVDLCYRRALKEDPTNEDTLKKYASHLYDKREKESALLMYRKLTDLLPVNQSYWTYLGNVYLDLKFYDKALVCYEKAHILSQGKESWIIGNIGNLYKNKGLYTKAIEYLREAIEVDNSSEYAHNRLSGAIELKNEQAKEENEIIAKKEKEMIVGFGEEAMSKAEENLPASS